MNELLHDLLQSDIDKSTGTDNIGPMILKVSAPFIVSPLTYIFNRLIDSGIYPNILKNAKVSPIQGTNVSLQITDLYPYYLLYQNYLKDISQDICISTWQNTIFYMMPNLVLDQIIPVKML
jgi:hypothetical protein